MAITTGAADTGVLNLDPGSRPRSGNSGDGDSFASALDTQMQKPRTDKPSTPRAKSDSAPQEPAAKGKTDDPPAPREARATEARRVEKGKEGDDKESGEQTAGDEADPARDLMVLLLQTKAPDPANKPAGTEAATSRPANESGKKLPDSSAQDAAAALVAAATTPAATDPAQATSNGMAASAPRAVDPRLTAAVPVADPATTLAGDGSNGRGADPSVVTSAAEAAKTPTGSAPAAPGSENLLQAVRAAVTGEGGAPKGDKADFAATLAALREIAPRGGGDGSAQINTAGAVANGPQQSGAATPANQATPNLPAVNVPVGQHGWDQVVGERVLWMTRHGMQEAKIELNPRDLGPLEVRVSVQQDQASVAFTAHTPAARDALEAAMPRLRDMLADSGLNLAQSDVSHRSPQQQAESGWGNGSQQGSGNLLGGGAEEQPSNVVETPLPSLGAVDYYA